MYQGSGVKIKGWRAQSFAELHWSATNKNLKPANTLKPLLFERVVPEGFATGLTDGTKRSHPEPHPQRSASLTL